MALLSTVWYLALALLGLTVDHERAPNAGRKCKGLHVRDGTVSCHNVMGALFCNVSCNGRYLGSFQCTEEDGWTPPLPRCATPIEDHVIDSGCPDDAKCNLTCQEDPRFKTGGSCVCRCESPSHATAKACRPKECMIKCSLFVIPMRGTCIGGICKCEF